jgi:hypothetical protein|tara:strand:+ start:456 stop:659 length:204 start_codon:yes stop_codon:yes gene_type:complete
MTMNLFGQSLTIEFRNGVGLDIEFSNSRPVWISRTGSEELEVAEFEGILIALPFILISLGICYTESK